MTSSQVNHKEMIKIEENSELQCSKCLKHFKKLAALRTHQKTCQLLYHCSNCGKEIKRKHQFMRHIKICSDKSINKCGLCDYQVILKSLLLKHYTQVHNIEIIEKKLEFNSWKAFDAWKNRWQTETKSQFITNGSHHHKEFKTHAFRCHRDGYFKSKGSGLKNIKHLGSNKINGHCPAKIYAKQYFDDHVEVSYCETHVGHDFEVARLNLSKPEKYMIAEKLALNIPFEEILDIARDSAADKKLSRIHLLSRHDLWNIAATFRLKYEKDLYKNYYDDVDGWIKHMQSSSDIIKLYKPQWTKLDEYPQLDTEDFLLVIMNEGQYEVFKKFGNDCICVDGTNTPNVNNIQLYTVMVFDDNRQGFPCCFLFSNRHDIIAMDVFFQTIQIAFSETSITPKSFMSDVDGIFYNAWQMVFGPIEHQLFNSWFVENDWRNNLSKLVNKNKCELIYDKLETLMFDTNIEEFEEYFTNFLMDLKLDPEVKDFYKYFQAKYENSYKAWAYCFREKHGIDTKMNVESVQGILKHIYSNKDKAKDLDRAIFLLMRFIRDKLFNRLLVINKEKIPKKLKDLTKKHLIAQTMEKHCTIINVKDFWKILVNSEIYKIEINDIDCNCELRCNECNYCVHAFSCSCLDFSIKWNMCKHIHLLCNVLNNQEDNEVGESDKMEIDTKLPSFDKRKGNLLGELLDIYDKIENEEQLLQVSKCVESMQNFFNETSSSSQN